jgi:hypothetical protein
MLHQLEYSVTYWGLNNYGQSVCNVHAVINFELTVQAVSIQYELSSPEAESSASMANQYCYGSHYFNFVALKLSETWKIVKVATLCLEEQEVTKQSVKSKRR